MLNNEMIDEYIKESGKYQIKLLDKDKYSIGSITLLHYRNRYFIITCSHCLKYVEEPLDVIVPIVRSNDVVRAFNLRNYQSDDGIDVASFEISFVDFSNTQNEKGYISDVIFDETDPLQNINGLIVINATNYIGFEREEDGEIISVSFTTLPYFSEIIDYDNDYYIVSASPLGISQDGLEYNVETFAGMSGSPAFKITETHGLQWLGILTNGDPDSGKIWVLNYQFIIEYLNSHYFND